MDEYTIDSDRVFNINTLSDKFPNLIISSDIDGDAIEFLGSMICKYPNKIELYGFVRPYGPPLIVSDYTLESGLYLMETKELTIEFFRKSNNSQTRRFRGKIKNTL